MSHNRSAFREKLAYYLLGVGIGCVILGIVFWGRSGPRNAPPSVPAGTTPPAPAPAPKP